MKTQANNNSKINSFKVSEQVKSILHAHGLSKAFNYSDYSYFKAKCKTAFNKPLAIAQQFIEENQNQSDLNQYKF